MNHTDQEDVLRVLLTRSETKAFYDKISRVYDYLADRSEEPIRSEALAMLDVHDGERVLEIGCGTGHSLLALAQSVGPSGKVCGIDLSQGMLQVARERVLRVGLAPRVELMQGDAEEMAYADESFDAILMTFTLELFDTPEIPRVLAECRRLLKSDGRIVIASITKEHADGILVHAFEWTHRHFPNLLDCRPIYVRRAVEKAGFDVADVRTRMMWVPVELVRGIACRASTPVLPAEHGTDHPRKPLLAT